MSSLVLRFYCLNYFCLRFIEGISIRDFFILGFTGVSKSYCSRTQLFESFAI